MTAKTMPPRGPQILPKDDQLVRVGKFEQVLEGFYDEVGQRCAVLLQEYHKLMVEPMALRLAYLELPFWRRWWMDLRALAATVAVWRKAGEVVVPNPEQPAEPSAAVSPAAAGPEPEGP